MTEQHPDPIAEGLSHGGQRLVQIVALAAAGRHVLANHQQRAEAARRAGQSAAEQEAERARRATFEQARSRWAPAHDRTWLRQADLLQVARAWSAALPFSAVHAAAASAVRKCEERLRELHPHAMDHYDRYRDAGLSPEEAMREATPFFSRDPNVRTGEPADRAELTEGTGTWWAANEHGPDLEEWQDHRQEQRALELIAKLQAEYRDQHLRPEDLRTALEIATNLPGRIITRALERHTATIEPAQSDTEAIRSSPTRTPFEVASDDFPYEIREAMHLVARQPPERPRTPKARRHSRHRSPGH